MDLSTVTIFSAIVTFTFSCLYVLAKRQLRPTSFEEAVKEQKANRSRELLLGKQQQGVPKNKKKISNTKAANATSEVKNVRKRAAPGAAAAVGGGGGSGRTRKILSSAKKQSARSVVAQGSEKQPKEIATKIPALPTPPQKQSPAKETQLLTTITLVHVHATPQPLLAEPEPQQVEQAKATPNKKKKHVEIQDGSTIEEFSPSSPPCTLHRSDSTGSNVSGHSILVNKEEASPQRQEVPNSNKDEEAEEDEEQNHFGTTKPADDYILMRRKSESSDDGRFFAMHDDGGGATAAAATESEPSDESIRAGPSNQQKPKKRKKKKDTTENITADELLQIMLQTTLTHSDVNSLVDALLNKSGDEGEGGLGLDDDPWVQSDEPSTISLQAMEAELIQALSDSEEALASIQSQLKELRSDTSAEKAKSVGYKKQLEEELVKEVKSTKQLERQISNFNAQLHSLQAQTIATTQEKDALRSQSQHLESQLQAAFNSNQELSQQLARLQEHYMAESERKNEEFEGVRLQIHLQMEERERGLLIEIGQREGELRMEMEKKLQEEEAQILEITSIEKNTRNLLASAQAQVKDLQSQLESKSSQTSSLTHSLQEQVATLNSQITGRKDDLMKYKELAASNDKSVEISSLKQQLASRALKCTEIESKLETMQKNFKKSSQSIVEVENELSTLRTTFEVQKAQNEILKVEMAAEESKIVQFASSNAIMMDNLKKTEALNAQLSGEWEVVNEILVQNGMIPHNTDDPSVFLSSKINLLCNQLTMAEKECNSYKAVLGNTEELLRNLHSSLIQHEEEWRVRLDAKEAELERIKQQQNSGNSQNNSAPQFPKVSNLSSSPSATSTTSNYSPSIDSLHIPSGSRRVKSPPSSLNQAPESESLNEDEMGGIGEKKKKKKKNKGFGSLFNPNK